MARERAGSVEAAEKTPLYLRIRDALAEAIATERLPKGALLLEGHVAGIFASTRTPVRQAFALLEAAGAKALRPSHAEVSE